MEQSIIAYHRPGAATPALTSANARGAGDDQQANIEKMLENILAILQQKLQSASQDSAAAPSIQGGLTATDGGAQPTAAARSGTGTGTGTGTETGTGTGTDIGAGADTSSAPEAGPAMGTGSAASTHAASGQQLAISHEQIAAMLQQVRELLQQIQQQPAGSVGQMDPQTAQILDDVLQLLQHLEEGQPGGAQPAGGAAAGGSPASGMQPAEAPPGSPAEAKAQLPSTLMALAGDVIKLLSELKAIRGGHAGGTNGAGGASGPGSAGSAGGTSPAGNAGSASQPSKGSFAQNHPNLQALFNLLTKLAPMILQFVKPLALAI
ncbi:hypothetical protein [Paraburkholderia hayleyella]|uniref:hypothetical protein n=1 Tax=Paraburkholderia hayleyella TaxID=2152889 RepID=UPI001580836F|nr:hypothetical protein [Paraburkholderia hayleyella]